MAAIDKCCAICEEFQDLVDLKTTYYDKQLKKYYPKYKRFESSNVCETCIKQHVLKGQKVNSFKYSKLKHKIDRSKGFIHYISEQGIFKRAHASRFEDTQQESILFPWLYEAIMKTQDDMYVIYNRDKRKLRKTLTKLGVVGKIKSVIR